MVRLQVDRYITEKEHRGRTSRGPALSPAIGGPPLVLGLGNILLGDDGAGIQLVDRLASEPDLRFCDFVDGGTMSFSLLSYVESTDSMLVIDAAELDASPGHLALFEGAAMDEFLKSHRRRTVHEVGLIDLLDMARLQESLPARRALLCVQPGAIDWNESLSAPVAYALVEAADTARRLLYRWNQA